MKDCDAHTVRRVVKLLAGSDDVLLCSSTVTTAVDGVCCHCWTCGGGDEHRGARSDVLQRQRPSSSAVVCTRYVNWVLLLTFMYFSYMQHDELLIMREKC